MPTPVGPNLVQTGADDAGVGSISWTNPGNITAEDGSFATQNLQLSQIGHYLKGTNPNLTVPAGATINGIVVEWKYLYSTTGSKTATDNAARIVQAGTIGSTDRSQNVWTTSNTWTTYGSNSDLWGLSWVPSDFASSGFGAALSAKTSAGGTGVVTCSVDACRITVYYTPAASGNPAAIMMHLLGKVVYGLFGRLWGQRRKTITMAIGRA